jgi:hypothetical protein
VRPLWPIVQTPVIDEDDFWSNWWNEIWQGKPIVLGENLPQRHFVHHKIPHDRSGLEPRTAAVGSQRLTALAMARPRYLGTSLECSASHPGLFLPREWNYSYFHSFQTDSEVHPAYPLVWSDNLMMVLASTGNLDLETHDHGSESYPPGTSSSSYAFMVWCWSNFADFTFYLYMPVGEKTWLRGPVWKTGKISYVTTLLELHTLYI